MQTEQIVLDRGKARALWQQYREHRQYSDPIDREVARTYHAIAQGKLVIKALESIKAAGLNEEQLPKLAIARATAKHCWCQGHADGSVIFATSERALGWGGDRVVRHRIVLPAGSMPGIKPRDGFRNRSIVPLIPLSLRPKKALDEYHVLYEAEWRPVPPVDPLLLRRVGEADLWIVVAAWDLTDVERAALAARVTA